MSRDERRNPRTFPVHERIRRRREARSMTGVELARLAGVSPAYVSLIEKGVKIPGEEVAVAIARALDDEPELYRAWALASRYQDLGSAWGDLTRAVRLSGDRQMRRWVSSGKDMSEGPSEAEPAMPPPAPAAAPPPRKAARERPAPLTLETQSLRHVVDDAGPVRPEIEVMRGAPLPVSGTAQPARASARGTPQLLRVPVLEAGADPGNGPQIPVELVVDDMLLDPRLVGGARLDRPFAFRADAAAVERLQGEARAGDWVVVTSLSGPLEPTALYAVRLRGRLVLSRVVLKGNVLLLPPGSGRSDIEMIEPARGERPERHLAGRVAAVVRTEGTPTRSAR